MMLLMTLLSVMAMNLMNGKFYSFLISQYLFRRLTIEILPFKAMRLRFLLFLFFICFFELICAILSTRNRVFSHTLHSYVGCLCFARFKLTVIFPACLHTF